MKELSVFQIRKERESGYLAYVFQFDQWDICFYFDSDKSFMGPWKYLSSLRPPDFGEGCSPKSGRKRSKIKLESLLTHTDTKIRNFSKLVLENGIDLDNIN